MTRLMDFYPSDLEHECIRALDMIDCDYDKLIIELMMNQGQIRVDSDNA